MFLNERGEVAEGARSNVFVGRDGTLLTPSLSSSGCLPGVLRAELLAACRTFSENHAKWDLRSEIRRNFQFYNSFERAFAQSTSENLRSGRAFPKSDRLLAAELAQHQRGRHGTLPDQGGQPQDFVPMGAGEPAFNRRLHPHFGTTS